MLAFILHWDFKHYNEYISQKDINLSTTNIILLKCDVIDGSVVNGIREPVVYSFSLDKLADCKVFCERETIH